MHNTFIYQNLPSGGAASTYKSILKKFVTAKKLKGIIDRPNNFISYLYLAIIKNLLHDLRLFKKIKKNDTLLCFQSWLINSPYILNVNCKKKIYICHEPPREFYDNDIINVKDFKERIVDIFRLPLKYIDLYNVRNSKAHIISNSFFSKNLIKNAYKLDSKVIYPGISNKFYSIKNYKKENKLISCGAINKLKRFDFIIRVVANIDKSSRPTLTIIGNGGDNKYINYLRKLARQHEVSLSIKLNITDNQLIAELSSAIGYIYAPLNEPFGLTIFQAMARGLCLFVYKYGGGYSELISPRNGIVFEDLNILNWSKSIQKFMVDKHRMKSISIKNKTYSKQFNEDKYSLEIYKYVESL